MPQKNFAMILFLLLCALPHQAYAENSKKIHIKDLPFPVLKSLRNTLTSPKIVSAYTEQEEGNTVYEIQGVLKNGRRFEFDVLPNGIIQEIEIVIPVHLLPQNIADEINARVNNFKIESVEASYTPYMSLRAYEITGNVDAQPMQLEVSSDGKQIFASDD